MATRIRPPTWSTEWASWVGPRPRTTARQDGSRSLRAILPVADGDQLLPALVGVVEVVHCFICATICHELQLLVKLYKHFWRRCHRHALLRSLTCFRGGSPRLLFENGVIRRPCWVVRSSGSDLTAVKDSASSSAVSLDVACNLKMCVHHLASGVRLLRVADDGIRCLSLWSIWSLLVLLGGIRGSTRPGPVDMRLERSGLVQSR